MMYLFMAFSFLEFFERFILSMLELVPLN